MWNIYSFCIKSVVDFVHIFPICSSLSGAVFAVEAADMLFVDFGTRARIPGELCCTSTQMNYIDHSALFLCLFDIIINIILEVLACVKNTHKRS